MVTKWTWSRYYKIRGLWLRKPKSRDALSLFRRDGHPVKFITPTEEFSELPTHYLIIRSIFVDKEVPSGLHMVVKTTGELPPGVRNGTYELTFNEFGACYKLPDEMFDDEEIPQNLLNIILGRLEQEKKRWKG